MCISKSDDYIHSWRVYPVPDTVLEVQDALVSNLNRDYSSSFISAARKKQLRGK